MEEGLGDPGPDHTKPTEHGVFPPHVVPGANLLGPPGRPAKHQLPVPHLDQIGEVGVAARELLDRDRTGQLRRPGGEDALKGLEVQLFAGADLPRRIELSRAHSLRRSDRP